MKKVIGIDIGATNTRVALIDGNGGIIKKVSYKTDPKTLIEVICRGVETFPGFEGIGISTIGLLDSRNGIILMAANAKIRDLEIIKPLRKRFRVPCYMFNDCIAGAMAEKFFGAGKKSKNIVYLTLSTGIGAGIIANDRLLLGKDGNANIVGHFTIDYNSGLRCGCGGYGHWESFCAGRNIPNYVKYLLKTDYKNRKSKLRSIVNMTAKSLFDLAKNDRVAAEIVDRIGKIDAIGIANVINAYDPELITIGGSVMLNNKNALMRQIRRWTGRYAISRMPRIEATALGDDICLLGAAAGVLHRDWVGQ